GWGVHPASAIARWVLGVRPGGPGFDPLMLAPMPGELKHVSGRVWTPKGPVEVSIRKAGEHREIQAAVPEGMPYRLVRDHLEVEDVVEIRGGQALPEP
ncbi:MAG: hypothetical protein IMZ65_03005, partial [Planctomycetes bacterium]|nr:hypothetical protein [Planctomycetota bacterium]